MTDRTRGRPDPRSPRLRVEGERDQRRLWTVSVGTPPPVYGERWVERGGALLRDFGPARSKLSAAVLAGWEGPLPREGERWLYLGAATGTTVSHVADLLGALGAVYAVEKSARPFQRLLMVARRWPNLRPILADARSLDQASLFVPLVDGLYADLPQPDQVDIVRSVAHRFLKERGTLLMALKTASMGRDLSAPMHLKVAEDELARDLELDRSVRLAPWHRGHYLIGGTARAGFMDLAAARPIRPRDFPGAERPSRRPRREGHGPDRPSDRGTGRWVPRPGRRGRTA